jgi:hypothetical protein
MPGMIPGIFYLFQAVRPELVFLRFAFFAVSDVPKEHQQA